MKYLGVFFYAFLQMDYKKSILLVMIYMKKTNESFI